MLNSFNLHDTDPFTRAERRLTHRIRGVFVVWGGGGWCLAGVGLGRLSGSAIGSNFTDFVTSLRGVGGCQRQSALSQSRASFSCVQITLVYSEYPPYLLRSIVEGFGSLQNPVPINTLLTAISFIKWKCLFTVYSTITVLYGWIKLNNLLNVLFIFGNTEYYKAMHRMCKKEKRKKKCLKKFAW